MQTLWNQAAAEQTEMQLAESGVAGNFNGTGN
jgi:hypothetical protein